MAKLRHVTLNIEEEWLTSLTALAGTFGVTADEAIRQSLPDEAVVGLFFQCKDYLPELRWDEVAAVGREAIREHLRAIYRKGLETHLARLGVDLERSSADEVEAAKQRALDELRADAERPLAHQVARAEEDSVYLGRLYDAWKRAKAGESGYAIVQMEAPGDANAGAWLVTRDEKPV
jgi:hypothetical protein